MNAIVDVVRSYVGCDAKNARCDDLATLCAREVDSSKEVLGWMRYPKFSNCAFFALGAWRKAGVQHYLLDEAYRTKLAMAWVIQVGTDLHATMKPARDGLPTAGALMMYYTKGKQDHHVEFCLEDASTEPRSTEHAGGGRANCAITLERSDIRWNNGRPLQYWFDAGKLLAKD
jgi:hypothetical protein